MENIYIMDNHLAAIWCWEKITKTRPLSILHIDAHYDLASSPPGEFMYQNIDLNRTLITEIESFKHQMGYNYFRWDNYIHLFNDKYPKLIDELIAITHRLGGLTKLHEVQMRESDIWRLNSLYLEAQNTKILNLDIDYFFMESANNYLPIFSEQTIMLFANWLSKNKDKFNQITIALSPECCGSWENSIDMANKILKPLEIRIGI